jgi:hypothetical protein
LADSQNGPLQPSSYHVGRLDDVRERLASAETAIASLASKADIEGIRKQIDSLATKEDVANAKLALMTLWVGVATMVVVGVVGALIRFWPD